MSRTSRDLDARTEPRDGDPAARLRPAAGRVLVAILFVACGVVAAFAAGRARRLGASLLERAVVVGDAPRTAADPTDARTFVPFAFGVVGPVRGDATALAASVEALAARGDVAFVVLLGDVTAAGDEAEGLRLAGAIRGRGVEVVAVGGAGDVAERRDPFQSFVGAPRWWFVHRECLIVGLPGAADDAAFVAARGTPAERPRATIVCTPADAPPPLAADAVVRAEPGVRVVHVRGEGAIEVETVPVAAGATLRSFVREASLGVVFPLVRSNSGLTAALAGSALLVAFGLARLVPANLRAADVLDRLRRGGPA